MPNLSHLWLTPTFVQLADHVQYAVTHERVSEVDEEIEDAWLADHTIDEVQYTELKRRIQLKMDQYGVLYRKVI